jgi:hypothetical protein
VSAAACNLALSHGHPCLALALVWSVLSLDIAVLLSCSLLLMCGCRPQAAKQREQQANQQRHSSSSNSSSSRANCRQQGHQAGSQPAQAAPPCKQHPRPACTPSTSYLQQAPRSLPPTPLQLLLQRSRSPWHHQHCLWEVQQQALLTRQGRKRALPKLPTRQQRTRLLQPRTKAQRRNTRAQQRSTRLTRVGCCTRPTLLRALSTGSHQAAAATHRGLMDQAGCTCTGPRAVLPQVRGRWGGCCTAGLQGQQHEHLIRPSVTCFVGTRNSNMRNWHRVEPLPGKSRAPPFCLLLDDTCTL